MHILKTNYLYFDRYFHVNFGFNSYFFDWFHDTLRKDDREYGEDIFDGKGKQPIETKKSSRYFVLSITPSIYWVISHCAELDICVFILIIFFSNN